MSAIETLPVQPPSLLSLDAAILPMQEREAAFERFRAQRSGREKPGRYWKVDLDAFDITAFSPDPATTTVVLENVPSGVTACDLSTAFREHRHLVERAFGKIVKDGKFASLTRAFAQAGAFVHIPAGLCADEPIVIRHRGQNQYAAPSPTHAAEKIALFPYVIVLAEPGARCAILERVDAEAVALVCSVTEILAEDDARVSHATIQTLPDTAWHIASQAARCGRNATVAWSDAELGGAVSIGAIDTHIAGEGANVDVATVFFANNSQHIDIMTSVEHDVGHSTSETVVKSVATGRGQGRYLGTIRIAKDAQGSDARLSDDALLLSKAAHIDSVPALEIAANDVKAFHGATVGAIDAEQLFYMESRGIPRTQAETMIALGFFEPAIARFPTEQLRDDIRSALSQKVA